VTPLLVGLAVLVAAVALVRIQVLHARRVRRERGQLFDRVHDVIDDARIEHDGLGYPVLTGWYRGHRIRLKPVVDTLVLRKLPSLWLIVTEQRRLDVGAPLDVLARPTGAEFFSPNATFAHDLEPPLGFPGHVRIATPDPARAPSSVLREIGPLFDDPRTKEVLVTAWGVRLVHQLAEGAQAPYRSTRRADFGPVQIVPNGLRDLLHTVTAIGDALADGRVMRP
jgi:hypothetical protein